MMKSTPQNQRAVSRMRQRAASAALAFAAALLPAVITTQSAQAQPFAVLHSFDTADGPVAGQAGVIQGMNGYFYGTTPNGGANSQGSIFAMTPSGTVTTIYSFCPPGTAGNCVDAGYPGALVLGTNGKIYGTTGVGPIGTTGAVFATIPSSGETEAIGFFQPLSLDVSLGIYVNSSGGYPVGALVQATDGLFWGVTQAGGALGQGTKFEVGPNGGLGSITTFGCIEANCNGAVEVAAGLVQGTDGSFYGTSETGGTGAFGGGQFGGSVFQITPSGSLTTLYSFCSLSDCTDGQAPMGALVQGADGNFYGTTASGGTGTGCTNANPNTLGCGTVFKITPSGALTTLHNFCTAPSCRDGQNPIAGLILGSDGNFYGTTHGGGRIDTGLCSDYVCGIVFRITPSGTLTLLHDFCYPNVGGGCPSGGGPVAPLVQDTNGKFYGTTTVGGNSSGNGTVFVLSTGLSPFVKTLPTSGLVGAAVKILGTGLTGATSVTFNGTAATFTAVSATLITTTVPAGATSGAVQVTTPSGTLSSNVNFLVTP